MSDSKKSQAQLSAEYGVSLKTIGRWKKEGIDVQDEHEVANHRTQGGSMSHDVHGSIHQQLADAKSYDEARFLKTKIEAFKHQHALEVSEGLHIKNSEVKEATIRILSILKAGMQKLESDLPNKLYGLDAADIQKEIRAATNTLLTQFSEIAQEEFGE